VFQPATVDGSYVPLLLDRALVPGMAFASLVEIEANAFAVACCM